MKLTYSSFLITTFSHLIKSGPLAAVKEQLVKCWDAGKRNMGVKFSELLSLLAVQSLIQFTNESQTRRRSVSFAAVLVRGGFHLELNLRSSPRTPALNILDLKHAGWRRLYIPAWYCTDCFSACHFKSLNPTDYTLLWHKTLTAVSSPLTLSMTINTRSWSLEHCSRHEQIISNFILFFLQ